MNHVVKIVAHDFLEFVLFSDKSKNNKNNLIVVIGKKTKS